MLDYQRIIDDVRAAMATSSDLLADDLLQQPATDYAAACVEVNERLRQCGSLLNRGLRSEAIQMAEIEPNLLDVVASLDFPERGQWDGLLNRCGVKTAPQLNLAVAAELNDAYAQERPLAVLLQQHRLFALAKQSLRARIDILRQLADVDPQNLVWEEDLATFEQERFKEIRKEAAEAAKVGKLTAVKALGDELDNTAWRETPPESLGPWVRQWAARLHAEKTVSMLEQIEPQLNDAFSSLDVEAGRRLREAWLTYASGLPDGSNGNLHHRVAPALQWLVDEDHKEALLTEHLQYRAALEKALDEEKPSLELQRLYHAAGRHGHDLPEEVVMRYQRRLDDIDVAARRKSRLVFVCVVGLLLFAAGLVGLFVYSTTRSRAVNAVVASVERLLGEDMLDEARDYLERLGASAPAVAKSPEVQAARAKLEGMERDEADRRAKVANRLELIASSFPTPGPGLLEETRKLVKLESERSKLLALETKIAAHDRGVRTKEEVEFQKEFQAILKRLDGLEPAGFPSASEYSEAIAALRSKVDDMQHKYPKVGQELRAQAQLVSDRIARMQEASKGRAMSEGREAAVDQTIGDVAAYRTALQEIIRQEPNSVRAKDIQRAITEAPLWNSWKAFADWASGPGKVALGTIAPSEAAQAAATLKTLLQNHPTYPATESLREWQGAMEAIGRRSTGGTPLVTSLKLLFQDALVAQAWVIVDSEGHRYYLRKEPNFDLQTRITFNYYTDFTFKEKGTFLKAGEVTYQGVAPQSEIAAKVNPLLESLKDDHWDDTMRQIVEAIVNGQTKVPLDPLLKRSLLKRTLETASEGSAAFAKVFAEYAKQMRTSQIADSANWVDPRASDIAQLREDAEKELAKLPDITATGMALNAESRRIRGLIPADMKWVGWMRRTGTGAWRYWPGEPPVRTAKLYVLRDRLASGRAVWETIGEVRDGKLLSSATASESHVEGRPVFAE